MPEKIILAYSGGLDTSVAVRWLAEERDFEVLTLTIDLGSQPDLETIGQRALRAGAAKAKVEDQRGIFVERYCWPALKAGALYQGQYPLATALGRPLIARRLVEFARLEGATWVTHGSTGKGNDQVRFDVAVAALARVPAQPCYLEINFEKGVAVGLGEKRMSPLDLVHHLNTVGGEYGVGRIDMVEDRFVGITSREVYEAPAATILHVAHRALEELVLEAEAAHFKTLVAQEYARLVYQGKWFASHRQDLDAYVDSSQRFVTGTVRIKLDRGTARVAGRSSPFSLYRPRLATYSAGDEFDHQAATGFIKLVGLPLRTQAVVQGIDGKSTTPD